MARLKPYIFPLLLFFFSFILRLSLLSKGPFHLDCLNLAIKSQETLATGELQHLFGSGYPLAVILGALFQLITPLFGIHDPVTAVNLMSAFFGALCIPAIFLVAQRLFDDTTAAVSSILLSICGIFLSVSVYGMSHAPALFFLLCGVLYLVKFWQSGTKRHLIIAGLLIGLMGATRAQDMVLILIPLTFLFFAGPGTGKNSGYEPGTWSERIKLYLLMVGLAVATAVLFHVPFLLGQHRQDFHNQFSTYFTLGVTYNLEWLFVDALVDCVEYLDISLTVAGVLMGALGFILFFAENPRLWIFFSLWFLVPLVFYGNMLGTVPRFLVPLLPPFIMAIGHLFTRITRIHIIFRYAMLFTLTLMIYLSLSHIYPILDFRHKNALLPDYGVWVGENTEPDAVIVTGDEKLFIEYYGHRKAMIKPSAALFWDYEKIGEFKKELDSLLRQNVPVYITGVGLYTYDYNKHFSNYMKRIYKIEPLGRRPIEDWHLGCIYQRLVYSQLFRLSAKEK